MFVGVKYFKDAPINGFAGNTYTYKTEMELNMGDIVRAPVKNRSTGTTDDKKALVVEVDLKEPPFECADIVSLWEENDDGNAG